LFKQFKKKFMKKILSVLAIAALVSCNNSAESTEVKPDTTAVSATADTTVPAPADTTATATADTTAAAK